jgi:hypothetical protein
VKASVHRAWAGGQGRFSGMQAGSPLRQRDFGAARRVGLFVLVVCLAGCGGSAKRTVAGPVSERVPVVRCPTSGPGAATNRGAVPASIVTVLRASIATRVSYYSGGLTVLAPRGWSCTSSVGEDGSADITVSGRHGTSLLSGS